MSAKDKDFVLRRGSIGRRAVWVAVVVGVLWAIAAAIDGRSSGIAAGLGFASAFGALLMARRP
jgi:hypothetical protein